MRQSVQATIVISSVNSRLVLVALLVNGTSYLILVNSWFVNFLRNYVQNRKVFKEKRCANMHAFFVYSLQNCIKWAFLNILPNAVVG